MPGSKSNNQKHNILCYQRYWRPRLLWALWSPDPPIQLWLRTDAGISCMPLLCSELFLDLMEPTNLQFLRASCKLSVFSRFSSIFTVTPSPQLLGKLSGLCWWQIDRRATKQVSPPQLPSGLVTVWGASSSQERLHCSARQLWEMSRKTGRESCLSRKPHIQSIWKHTSINLLKTCRKCLCFERQQSQPTSALIRNSLLSPYFYPQPLALSSATQQPESLCSLKSDHGSKILGGIQRSLGSAHGKDSKSHCFMKSVPLSSGQKNMVNSCWHSSFSPSTVTKYFAEKIDYLYLHILSGRRAEANWIFKWLCESPV